MILLLVPIFGPYYKKYRLQKYGVTLFMGRVYVHHRYERSATFWT